MRDTGSLKVLAAFLLLLAIGAVMQARIHDMREAKSFYRWIQAAATNERILQSRANEFSDDTLLAQVETVADSYFAGTVAGDAPAAGDASLLSKLVADVENNRIIWNFARSAETAALREEFLSTARKNQLLFAKNLDLADAQAKNVSLFNMFFGFRKIAANLLWIEVDRNYRVGQVHRVIPMMKTVTALDPNFVDAYLIGSWHLAYNVTAKLTDTPPALREWNEDYQACVGDKESYYYEAAEFLKDGIRNNPRNYKLYFDLGFGIYDEKIKDYGNAVLYLREATRQPHERWVPRMLNRSLESDGQLKEALQGWRDYKANYPSVGFDTADRFIIRTEGRVEEQTGIDLRKQAETVENLAERDSLLAQAKMHEDNARAKYTELAEPYTDARLMMMDAREMARQGRYFEAQAMLDNARWNSGELFQEISDMIIEYKQAGNIPLNVSERKEVLRRVEGNCTGAPALVEEAVGS